MLHDLTISLWAGTLCLAVPLAVLALYGCYWTTYAWHSPDKHANTRFQGVPGEAGHSFSLIIPAREEAYEVLRATATAALRQQHPRVQVVLTIGYDDPATLAVARRLIEENPGGRLALSVSRSPVHNKPTQLNSALADCTGEIIGVLDAESVSAPGLLRQVDAAFGDPAVTVVQGGVIMTNFRSSFVALRSALEYFAHHGSKMHFTAAHGSVLMGGNTIFFRREVLDALDGWDEANLTEDADLSLRLLALGHRVTVAYDPELVTREEAPTSIRAWTKQRTRWNLGFLQTLAKGSWRHLPAARERRMAAWNLLQPTVMAACGVALPLAVVAAFTKPPLWLAMTSWLPAVPTLLLVAIEGTMLAMFGRQHGFHVRLYDYARLVVSAPAYQALLSFAALRAGVKYLRGDYRWEKTVHTGLHLVDAGAGALLPDTPHLDSGLADTPVTAGHAGGSGVGSHAAGSPVPEAVGR